ncbi:NAD-dependent epimerase/dehydratase family protein [Pseudomonas mediterranea]|uniref:UDP-glucose 4-epimerase family protein n=1 Tax=Pseudomonas mediterranea TaxID=183795 RepID=UPI001317C44B|nr:SDR family oxidoreductase [Pseudomonas mediterranea]QHA81710.1 NAD-dependent epimerase/dehydratase family protein [Pseudomonas mediterranea]
MKRTVLVTGANGFVGGAVLERLQTDSETSLIAVVRGNRKLSTTAEVVRIEELSSQTPWQSQLAGVDAIIHCASRVHVMNDTEVDPLAAFRRVNVEGTINFAKQAAEAGVRRFIFISSIKVNGEGTAPGLPYTADDIPAPVDPYGVSKSEAEQGLRQLAKVAGMEVVIIRPVLVYGPGVKANFLSMIRWLDRGIPLPFGAIDNRRSLVSIDNLVDLIVTCIDRPAAANQTFLVSDGEDLSTTALLSRMARSLGKPARLIPVPAWLLKSGAGILGKAALSQRLCGSLQVDIDKTRMLLKWAPPVSVDDALAKTARYFRANQVK